MKKNWTLITNYITISKLQLFLYNVFKQQKKTLRKQEENYKIHWSFQFCYTECNRRNGPDFGRVFLRSNYTDITQNTYIKSSMVTEIMAREF